MAKYVALLRGINLGKRQIKMDALRKAFEDWGYENASTLLASGNVIFEASGSAAKGLAQKIESGLKASYGFAVPVILRSGAEIDKLVRSDPFQGVKVTPKTRLFVTFLAEKPKNKPTIPYKSKAGDFIILDVVNRDVISVLTDTRTPDAMNILRKQFGDKITTRNWNTMLKIRDALRK
ncbi:MAG: DUF1697 domain-containing protein [Anaerolineales bacterium]